MNFDLKYAQYYDLFNSGKDYSHECNFLEEVFRKYSKRKVETILDLGCGTGRHDEELAKRGYKVTGLDLSPEMIEIAKRRNSSLEFIVGDMANFYIERKFDSVICMFSALGYLTENKKVKEFFKCSYEHLKPNGLLILDVWNGLGVLNELPSSREKIVESGKIKIIRKSFPRLNLARNLNEVRFNIKIFENERMIEEYEENHKVRFFFAEELSRYLGKGGFQLNHLCPSYDLSREVMDKDWNMTLISNAKS